MIYDTASFNSKGLFQCPPKMPGNYQLSNGNCRILKD